MEFPENRVTCLESRKKDHGILESMCGPPIALHIALYQEPAILWFSEFWFSAALMLISCLPAFPVTEVAHRSL